MNQSSIPVILVRGFLEAGKTTFLQKLMEGSDICTERTLLITCEEGECEYDSELLNRRHVTLIELEDESLLDRDYLETLASEHLPTSILIECNVMWKMIEFELPRNWQIIKRIAILAGPTLDLYLNNMRSYLGPMLSRCDEIRINRSEPEQLSSAKAKLRPLLDDPSVVIIEASDQCYGLDDVPDQLPYVLDAEPLAITSENYVYWFYDCQDRQERYDGVQITLQGDIKKSPMLPVGDFALGRIAITCCEADMSFLGFLAHYERIDDFSQFSHIKATAIIRYRFMKQYNKIMPYLEIIHMEQSAPDEDIAAF